MMLREELYITAALILLVVVVVDLIAIYIYVRSKP